MIRRPPSGIALRQSDVVEMEAFLAERRAAQALEDKNNQNNVPTAQSNSSSKAKGKGKGKQKATGPVEDELMENDDEARNAKEAKTREERIGL